MTTMINDEKVLKKCLKGDSAAFELIVEKYQNLVTSITYSGTADFQISEELAHLTFVNAWKKLGQLKELHKFQQWLSVIARNNVKAYYRKQQRDVVSKAQPVEEAYDAASVQPDPLTSAISLENQKLVREAIEQIPESYREPIVLYYRQGQSVQEVAQYLGLKENVVRQRLHRGRGMIKKQLSSLVEETLKSTRPSKTFTTAVVTSISGLAIEGAGTIAAGLAATKASGLGVLVSGATAKVITAAAVAMVAIGSVVYIQNTTPPAADKSKQVEQPASQQVAKSNDAQSRFSTAPKTSSNADQDKSLQQTDETYNTESNQVEDIIPNDSANTQVNNITPKNNEDESEESQSTNLETTEEKTEYEFQAKGVLSGLLTDIDSGIPIVNAEVRLSSSGKNLTVSSDENGFYSFDKIEKTGDFRLCINSWDYVCILPFTPESPNIRLEHDEKIVRHFKLARACQVQMIIKDHEDNPLENARVRVTKKTDRNKEVGAEPYHNRGNLTDEQGKVMLGGLAKNDRYFITVVHTNSERRQLDEGIYTNVAIHNYAPEGLEIFLDNPDKVERLEVSLEKIKGFRAFSYYKDGQPNKEIDIGILPIWWNSPSLGPSFSPDENGYLNAENIKPGLYNITARVPIRHGGRSVYSLLQTKLPPKDGEILSIELPFNSPAASTAVIAGHIEWVGDGQPGYIELEARQSFGNRSYSTSLSIHEDYFELEDIEPGTYTIRIVGQGIKPITLNQVKAPTEELDIVIETFNKPRLQGVVVDKLNGVPVDEYEIRIVKVKDKPGLRSNITSRWVTLSGDAGKYDLEVNTPGYYKLCVRAEGYGITWSEMIDSDLEEPVKIELYPGGSRIQGKVLNEEGRPVENAQIIALSKAQGLRSDEGTQFVSKQGAVQTDSQGKFFIENLPEGHETLRVVHSDYTFIIKEDIPVKNGLTTHDVDIILPQGGSIEGIVYDQLGKPQEGQVLYAQTRPGNAIRINDSTVMASAVTDANGYYRMDGLPENICYLIHKDEYNSYGVTQRNFVPQKGKMMRIDLGGQNELKGQLIYDGVPQANVKVVLSSPYSSWKLEGLRAKTFTDSKGHFSFKGILPGHYGLFSHVGFHNHYKVKLMDVNVPEGDLDLKIVPKSSLKLNLAVDQADINCWLSLAYVGTMNTIPLPFDKLKNPEAPFMVSPLQAGLINVQLSRSGSISYNHQIALTTNSQDVTKIFQLPDDRGVIHGKISEDIKYICIESEDGRIQSQINQLDNGQYKFEHLPPGDYRLGLYSLLPGNSIKISLAEDESKNIDISSQTFDVPYHASNVTVSVVSESGFPFHAKVTMHGHDIIEPDSEFGWQTTFKVLPGNYVVQAVAEGYQPVEKEFNVKAINNTEKTFSIFNNQSVLIQMKKKN